LLAFEGEGWKDWVDRNLKIGSLELD